MAWKAFLPQNQAAALLGYSKSNFSTYVDENPDLLTPALPHYKKRVSMWSIIQLKIFIDVTQFERTGGKYGVDRKTGKLMLELSLQRLGELSVASQDMAADLYKEIVSEIKDELRREPRLAAGSACRQNA